MEYRFDYGSLLDKCVAFHGHLCMGQVLGVRVAAKGLQLTSPNSPGDLIVAVEIDRCLADAVLTVTGTRIGRRNLKLYNYGLMAASFLNCSTGKAYRVRAAYQGPQPGDDEHAMRSILMLPDEQMVAWKEVEFFLPDNEMPGKPKRTVQCSVCGEKIFDGRDRPGPNGPICSACLDGAYYKVRKS